MATATDIKIPAARKFAVDAHRAGYRVRVPSNTDRNLSIDVLDKVTGETLASATWTQTHVGGAFGHGFATGGDMALRFSDGMADGRFVKTLRSVRESLGLR